MDGWIDRCAHTHAWSIVGSLRILASSIQERTIMSGLNPNNLGDDKVKIQNAVLKFYFKL